MAGTYTQFDVSFRKMGIQVTFVEPDDPENFRKAITPKTKCLYGETISNPRGNVLDIEAVAAIAHERKIPLVIDNTFATPYLCRPIDFGADIVVHSLTKFMGGHGNSIGGILVDSGRFAWAEGNFPQLTEPSPAYHGMRYVETFGDLAYIVRARVEGLRDMGTCISPFNSFLILQGIETLGLRMERHVANALAVAKHLESHKLVKWVKYPSLPPARITNWRKSMCQGRRRGLLLRDSGRLRRGPRVHRHVKLFSHLANVGDARSLVIHPSSTTHQQLKAAEQEAAGVTPDMVRISIGLEDLDDILWDLDQALEKSQG